MQVYKCSSCGAELNFEPNSNICVCEYCGSKNAVSGDGLFIGWNPKLTEYTPDEATEVEFSMQIDDIFTLADRGTAVVGQIDCGSVNVNDCVKILSDNGNSISCTVAEIEQFRRKLDCAQKGENIGLVLSGVTKQQINKGDIIIKGKLDLVSLNQRITSYYMPIGDKLNAVNYYRKVTGLGLKAAKDKIERLFKDIKI